MNLNACLTAGVFFDTSGYHSSQGSQQILTQVNIAGGARRNLLNPCFIS